MDKAIDEPQACVVPWSTSAEAARWQGLFENLAQRFPSVSPSVLVEAIRENDGHAGRAAKWLREQSARAASKGGSPPPRLGSPQGGRADVGTPQRPAPVQRASEGGSVQCHEAAAEAAQPLSFPCESNEPMPEPSPEMVERQRAASLALAAAQEESMACSMEVADRLIHRVRLRRTFRAWRSRRGADSGSDGPTLPRRSSSLLQASKLFGGKSQQERLEAELRAAQEEVSLAEACLPAPVVPPVPDWEARSQQQAAPPKKAAEKAPHVAGPDAKALAADRVARIEEARAERQSITKERCAIEEARSMERLRSVQVASDMVAINTYKERLASAGWFSAPAGDALPSPPGTSDILPASKAASMPPPQTLPLQEGDRSLQSGGFSEEAPQKEPSVALEKPGGAGGGGGEERAAKDGLLGGGDDLAARARELPWYLIGDPWQDSEDIAEQDLATWFEDFLGPSSVSPAKEKSKKAAKEEGMRAMPKEDLKAPPWQHRLDAARGATKTVDTAPSLLSTSTTASLPRPSAAERSLPRSSSGLSYPPSGSIERAAGVHLDLRGSLRGYESVPPQAPGSGGLFFKR
eukprot:TRINITY_DN5372_c0_g3_i1.p1 TRINITY_DN5372_c0_g3~~TRINITY_DN5372_c0_g3_i1.p1  ORF type:complete len:578 (+),score=149.12 TRINITY_DN5372_c0_g3_i1:131-1864(+)